MRRLAIFAILLLVVCVIACGCTSKTQYTSGSDEPGPTPSAATPATPAKLTGTDRLQILTHDIEYHKSLDMLTVVATAKNIGDTPIWRASVEVKYYDRQGDLLDTWRNTTYNVEPGKTGEFTLYSFAAASDVDSYTIRVCECRDDHRPEIEGAVIP